MTRLYAFVLTTGLIFMGITLWLSPRFLAWYASPPVEIGVTCDFAMKWAMEKLTLFQSLGLLVGMLLGLAIALWLKPKREAAPDATSKVRSNENLP